MHHPPRRRNLRNCKGADEPRRFPYLSTIVGGWTTVVFYNNGFIITLIWFCYGFWWFSCVFHGFPIAFQRFCHDFQTHWFFHDPDKNRSAKDLHGIRRYGPWRQRYGYKFGDLPSIFRWFPLWSCDGFPLALQWFSHVCAMVFRWSSNGLLLMMFVGWTHAQSIQKSMK